MTEYRFKVVEDGLGGNLVIAKIPGERSKLRVRIPSAYHLGFFCRRMMRHDQWDRLSKSPEGAFSEHILKLESEMENLQTKLEEVKKEYNKFTKGPMPPVKEVR